MSKHLFILAILLLSSSACFSQTKAQKVQAIMNSVSIDSLLKTVSQFTGEEDVVINGNICRIKTRSMSVDSSYTYLAEEYLIQRFREYGYIALADTFNPFKTHNPQSTNLYRHIYSIKKGETFPDKYYYISSHFDCSGEYKYLNYGADDNASGTAAVLEAARHFANISTDYSIVFMLLNAEECNGGDSHIDLDSIFRKSIVGSVNFDMIAYDGDNDGLINLHCVPGKSKEFAAIADSLNSQNCFNFNIEHFDTDAGMDYYFYRYDIPTITFSEDTKIGGDMNPGYHSNNDRMDKFNNTYYHNIARLGIGTFAELVLGDTEASVIEENDKHKLSVYPNPVTNTLNIKLSELTTANTIVTISNYLGNEILARNIPAFQSDGSFALDVSSLSNGVYFLKVNAEQKTFATKFIVSKK